MSLSQARATYARCTECKGSGRIKDNEFSHPNDPYAISYECPNCDGYGLDFEGAERFDAALATWRAAYAAAVEEENNPRNEQADYAVYQMHDGPDLLDALCNCYDELIPAPELDEAEVLADAIKFAAGCGAHATATLLRGQAEKLAIRNEKEAA